MTYPITKDYIKHGNARSGKSIDKVGFLVSHDTGNPGSTAHGNRKYFDSQQPSASAHCFIDDKYILEIVPLDEKAWHVQYNKPYDNRLFGDDANDCAIGTELCYGGSIDFQEAYKRYVWYHAYLCKKYALNPYKDIVGHYTLDPERRTDPLNAFAKYGITWSRFINDVVNELNGNGKIVDREEQVKSEVVTKPSKGGKTVIKKGDKGKIVGTVQRLVGAKVDNDFGPITEREVKDFQRSKGISADGIVGKITWSHLTGDKGGLLH